MTKTRYRVVERLEEGHVHELVALYQNEWWSKGRTLEDVRKMLRHSELVFGLVESASNRLVGFARVLTDRVYRAIVFDVIVTPERRGHDLGKLLMDAITAHPDLAAIDSLELHCLPELEPFYARWNFARNTSGTSTLRRGKLAP
ncbi:MAG: GNAT family N-acetyltransferase [Methyloceanibacter sp.]